MRRTQKCIECTEEDTWNKVRENKEKKKEIRESELGSEEKVEKGDEGEEEEEQLQRRRRRKKRSREGEGEVRNNKNKEKKQRRSRKRRRKEQSRRKKRSREEQREKWIIFQRNNDHTIPHEKILRDHFVYLGKLNFL